MGKEQGREGRRRCELELNPSSLLITLRALGTDLIPYPPPSDPTLDLWTLRLRLLYMPLEVVEERAQPVLLGSKRDLVRGNEHRRRTNGPDGSRCVEGPRARWEMR